MCHLCLVRPRLWAKLLVALLGVHGGVFANIGVAPASFFGETVGQRPDVWWPVSMQATALPVGTCCATHRAIATK
ncbi:MAG: hypothetical protein GEU99_03225 [Luteitalea sp.]|nr:hypothetical protein [Luteitalea sp.]